MHDSTRPQPARMLVNAAEKIERKGFSAVSAVRRWLRLLPRLKMPQEVYCNALSPNRKFDATVLDAVPGNLLRDQSDSISNGQNPPATTGQ